MKVDFHVTKSMKHGYPCYIQTVSKLRSQELLSLLYIGYRTSFFFSLIFFFKFKNKVIETLLLVKLILFLHLLSSHNGICYVTNNCTHFFYMN